MHKTKIAEPQMKMVKTDTVELNVNVPNLSPENAKLVARDVRRTLENCGKLEMLDEFVEILRVEHAEVPMEEAN